MRTLFTLSYAANLALAAASYFILPPRVAIHFGESGAANSWASAETNVLLMAVVHTLVYATFITTPWIVRRTPARWVNVPHREYWMRPEHRERMVILLMRQLYGFGTWTFAFMLVVGGLALQANLATPVRFRIDLFWWPFGIYVLYTLVWSLRLRRVFRIPADEKAR